MTDMLLGPGVARHPSTQVRLLPERRPEFAVQVVPGGDCLGAVASDAYLLTAPVEDRGGRPATVLPDRLALIVNPGAEPVPPGPGDTLVVRLGRDLVERELASMMGRHTDGPVRFDRAVDLRRPPTDGLVVLLEDILGQHLRANELLDRPAVRLRRARTLAAALLLSQTHTFTGALVLGQSPSRPRTLHRAMHYAADHLAEAVTLGDLAASAGCSARTLSSAFRDHLGVTPMTYLRNLRLERVRDELLTGTDTIGTVAYRWGFGHLGRFAGVYAQRFGELPSQTLARA